MIDLEIRPKVERGGFKLDRFEAWMDGEHVVTSRQPYLDGARKLIERGHDPDALMRLHPDAEGFPLSWWAQWTVRDTDRRGLKRSKWAPMPSEMWAVGGKDGRGGACEGDVASDGAAAAPDATCAVLEHDPLTMVARVE